MTKNSLKGLSRHNWSGERPIVIQPGWRGSHGTIKLNGQPRYNLVSTRGIQITIQYACESWTLTAELQRRIQDMEMRCYRKVLHISYKDHVTNEEVRAKIQQAIGPYEDLLTIVKKNANCSDVDMSSVHQVWSKPSCKAQWKGEEGKADRGRGGKTISGAVTIQSG